MVYWIAIWFIGLLDYQNVNICICGTIMAEVLVRAGALVVIARNVLSLHTKGHTL